MQYTNHGDNEGTAQEAKKMIDSGIDTGKHTITSLVGGIQGVPPKMSIMFGCIMKKYNNHEEIEITFKKQQYVLHFVCNMRTESCILMELWLLKVDDQFWFCVSIQCS
jgi:hypothetical protein